MADAHGHRTGEGWLFCGLHYIGQVTYAMEIADSSAPVGGTARRLHLSNHSIDARRWQKRILTLQLADAGEVSGFLSADGCWLTRTTGITVR